MTDAAAEARALAADYDRFVLAQDPILAGQHGDRDALRRWPDASPAAIAGRRADLAAFAARLDRLQDAPLTGEDAVNRDFIAQQVGQQVEGLAFDEERLCFQADDGFFHLPDYIAQTTVIRSADDAEAWLERLRAIAGFYATHTANARRGLATGYIQPDVVVDAALTTVRAQAEQAPQDSALLAPFANADQRLRERALRIVRDEVQPARRAFLAFLEDDYRPQARATLGLCSLPNGEAHYAHLCRRYTTTAMTPEQIHAVGLEAVAAIRARMAETLAQTGFSGSFAEFLAFLRTDPRFYAKSRQALLDHAGEIAARIDAGLPRWFGRLPQLPYEVRPVPADIEESYTSGRYWPGSPEQGAPAGYLVNTSHLSQRPLFEFAALTLHEATPGHHTQIALAQETTRLPLFRRGEGLTAYVEGWALYAEGLGEEMGIYRDPYELFGRLSFDAWRACRLVVDTGLHHVGWSRAKAMAYLSENTALSQKNVAVEIDRYIGWAGQALAYKVGEMKIWSLRRSAEAALGPRFDLRAFHDLILSEGPLPLRMLEAQVEGWIAASG